MALAHGQGLLEELVELEGQAEAVGAAGEGLPVRLGDSEPDAVLVRLVEEHADDVAQ